MARLPVGALLSLWIFTVVIIASCCGQGLPSDTESVLAASSASVTLAKRIDQAQKWREQFESNPSGACSSEAGSLCANETSASSDSVLLLALSPDSFDLRDPNQTGGRKVVTPVLDQEDCNTCTAFAVGAAAEIALAIALNKNATSWFSPQDFFFCSSLERGQERQCRSSWLIEPALSALVKQVPTTPSCLPYTPHSNNPCTYECRDTNPDTAVGQFVYARLTNEVDMQQWIRRYGPVLTFMMFYQKDLFTFLAKNPEGIYRGPGQDSQEDGEGHAVVLVGYNNIQRYWIARSSWGPEKGMDGNFKVAYGAIGIADTSKTWGLRFKPLKPSPPFSASQISPATSNGCFYYKASRGDFFSRVADNFGVPLKRLLADNVMLGPNAADLGGNTVLVCNSKDVASVLPPTTQADALLKIKAAIDPTGVLSSWVLRADSKVDAYCSWVGVNCDGKGNVEKLIFNELVKVGKLSGVLPDVEALLALPELRELFFWSTTWQVHCLLSTAGLPT